MTTCGCNEFDPALNRRDWLRQSAAGFGYLALAGLLNAEAGPARGAESGTGNPLATRAPHFAPRARRVIFLFMHGGPSQVDTFDYKPLLTKLHGKPVPAALKQHSDKVGGVFNHCKDELMAGPWKWQQHGQCGLWASELMSQTARHGDDL